MKLLIDSHALLWFVWDHPNLGPKVRGLMADSANELLISVGSLWEIAIKVSLGKLTLAEPYDVFLDQAISTNNLTILPITLQHASLVSTLRFHHRDPFDRLLIAQAIVEQISIVSGDLAFDAYPVTRMWESIDVQP